MNYSCLTRAMSLCETWPEKLAGSFYDFCSLLKQKLLSKMLDLEAHDRSSLSAPSFYFFWIAFSVQFPFYFLLIIGHNLECI